MLFNQHKSNQTDSRLEVTEKRDSVQTRYCHEEQTVTLHLSDLLTFGADHVAHDVGAVGGAAGCESRGLPAHLQHPWGCPTMHLDVLRRERRTWRRAQQGEMLWGYSARLDLQKKKNPKKTSQIPTQPTYLIPILLRKSFIRTFST